MTEVDFERRGHKENKNPRGWKITIKLRGMGGTKNDIMNHAAVTDERTGEITKPGGDLNVRRTGERKRNKRKHEETYMNPLNGAEDF